jgi:hypothetical protein
MVGDWLNRFLRTHANTAHTTGVTGSGELGAGARNGLSRLVTTVFRKPTTPVTGATSCAVEATGAVTGVTDVADSTLLAVVASAPLAVVTMRDVVTVGDCCVATTLTAATEVVGGDGAVTALEVGACFEFDSDSARLDVGCSGSGAGVTGNSDWVSVSLAFCVDSALVDAAGVVAADSVVLVCAPPLLLTVTPGPTWALDDVAPDVELVPAVSALAAVDVDPELVVVKPLSVDGAVEVPVPVASAAESVPAGEESVDVEVVPDVSAVATPAEVTTIAPMPKAAASAPTRPM